MHDDWTTILGLPRVERVEPRTPQPMPATTRPAHSLPVVQQAAQPRTYGQQLPSMSALPRAMQCAPSTLGPQFVDEAGEDAERGTAIHSYLADVEVIGELAALDAVDERWRDDCAAIPLDELRLLLPGRAVVEPAVAYDVSTGRVRFLGADIGRNYESEENGPLGAWEIAGASDRAGVVEGARRLVVIDYKTGRNYVPRARDNWQLRMQALAFARLWDCESVDAAILYVRPHERPYLDRVSWVRADLDRFAAELRRAVEGWIALRAWVAAGNLPTAIRRGSWCRYCPVRETCPAQLSLLASLLTQAGRAQTLADVLAALRNGGDAYAYEVWCAITQIGKDLGERLRDRAHSWPIRLPDGREYGPTQSAERVVGHELVYATLAEHYGDAVASAAVVEEKRAKATKASIRAALAEVARVRGTSLAEVEREAIGLLRSAGALRTVETIKEH